MNQLEVIEHLNPIEIYAPEKVDAILSKISEQVKAFEPDVSTDLGRKKIASLAYKIAQSKTFLDNCGKQLGEEHKKALDTINAERKKIRDNLDALKEEARKPLTEWEIAEENRKQTIQKALNEIEQMGNTIANTWMNAELSTIEKAFEAIKLGKDQDWQDYKDEADTIIPLAEAKIQSALESKKLHIEQQAELKKLREEKEERDRLESERLEKAEKEAKEKAEAEEKVKAEERAKQEAIEREAKAKKDEEDRIAAQKAREEKAKADQAAAVKREQELADKRVKEAEEKAAKDKADALEKERKRIQDEKAAHEAAEAKRQANIKHRTKVNNEVLKALMAEGVSEDHGKKIIVAMVSGLIPHVKLSY